MRSTPVKPCSVAASRSHPPSHGGANPSSDSTSASSPRAQNPEPEGSLPCPLPPARGLLRSLRRRWGATVGGGEAAAGAVPAGAVGDPVGGAARAGAGKRRGRGADGGAGLGRLVAAAAAGAHLRVHLRRRRQVLLRRRAPPLRPHRAPITFNLD